MRLLLDMGIPRRAAVLLRQTGIDAVHLSERGLTRLPDEAVLALAAEEHRVVVTLDADFAALLALSGVRAPSVVHLRLEGLDHRQAAQTIQRTTTAIEDDLASGCIASVTWGGIRVRHLPIHPRD